MRITRRPSGGRGEYEISEPSPEGITAKDLRGREIILELPDGWRIRTGLWLSHQGQKPRLRILNPGHGIHIARQLSAALMLPNPVREKGALGAGEPIMQRGRYFLEHVLQRIAGTVAELTQADLPLRRCDWKQNQTRLGRPE